MIVLKPTNAPIEPVSTLSAVRRAVDSLGGGGLLLRGLDGLAGAQLLKRAQQPGRLPRCLDPICGGNILLRALDTNRSMCTDCFHS